MRKAEKVVAYGSRLQSKLERKYFVTRRELLAVVVFTKQFVLTCLVISFFLRQTMVLSLGYGILWNQKDSWQGGLRSFKNSTLKWCITVAENTSADALSRLPCSQCKRDSHNAEPKAVLAVYFSPDQSAEELSQLQRDDPTIGPILQAMTTKY